MMHRYFEVRMLVKDESLRIKDIVKQTGYDKGHVSRLRKASQLDKLIADAVAAEREKLAAWMMRQGYATGHGDTVEDLLKELEWQIDERIRNEREACAKVCDVLAVHPEYASDITKVAAQAIRARGNK
jgi:hypothetical protein